MEKEIEKVNYIKKKLMIYLGEEEFDYYDKKIKKKKKKKMKVIHLKLII